MIVSGMKVLDHFTFWVHDRQDVTNGRGVVRSYRVDYHGRIDIRIGMSHADGHRYVDANFIHEE